MNVNRLSSHQGISFRYMFICLSLFLFALRSLIPFGYMPNMQAFSQGKIEITVCSPSGTPTVVSVDLSNDQHPLDNAHDGMMSCPFSSINALSMLVGLSSEGISTVSLSEMFVPSLEHSQVTKVRRLGPPLGSRAPPLAFI